MSSWMRFIQCARYKEEQNMTVFQYCGNVYYRAFRHIPAGRELLVWYDEKYSEFIDIPALMKARVVKGTIGQLCLIDLTLVNGSVTYPPTHPSIHPPTFPSLLAHLPSSSLISLNQPTNHHGSQN